MNEEQNAISFVSILPLKESAMLHIVLRLLPKKVMNNPGGYYAAKFGNYLTDSDVFGVAEDVKRKLLHLPLPNELIQEMSSFICPIQKQIFAWNSGADAFISKVNVSDLRLTSIGTVDEPAVIRNLILKGEICEKDAFIALNWATRYCLVDCIEMLLKKFPTLPKQFHEKKSSFNRRSHLMMYWVSFFENRLSNVVSLLAETDKKNKYDSCHSLNKNMCSWSIYEGYESAVNYFWPKLTTQERNESLVSYIDHLLKESEYQQHNCYRKLSLLFFFLSQVNDREQQDELLKKNSKNILQILLHFWPWQKYLVKTIKQMFKYLEKKTYFALMTSYIAEAMKAYKNVNELFKEIWCASPSDFKKFFIVNVMQDFQLEKSLFGINEFVELDVLFELMLVDDFDAVKMVLDDASEYQKKRIVFAVHSGERLRDLIVSDRVSILDLLAKELSSERDINRCDEIFLYRSHELFVFEDPNFN